MAARMSETSTLKMDEILDSREQEFVHKVKKYVSDVKVAIKDETAETAGKMFYSAMTFLSQDPPCSAHGSYIQTRHYESDSTAEMKALRDRVDALEKQMREDQQEAHKICSSVELQVGVSADSMRNKVLRLTGKLEELKNQVQALESEAGESIIDLSQVSTGNRNAVKGLSKLPALLRQRKQKVAAAAAAVTSPPTAPSASALSRPLKDVRLRNSFDAKIRADQNDPCIMDVQLLPGGMLLLADFANDCVKLFDTQGQHLHTLECRSKPCCLAVLDSSCIRHTVAVTLPGCSGIDILEVNGDNMEVKRTLQTSRQYVAVAAVNNLTLAVGYWPDSGIDLIDLGGQVLRQICSSVDPDYMDITEDGGLVCSTMDDKIARVQVDTGTVGFDKSVPQIKDPRGVTITPDGSILVTDRSNNTLHLVSSQGDWMKQLWSVPSDGDRRDELYAVSTDGSVCVCVTEHGSVYILDCL